jgi:hypothetical protein
MVAAVGEDKQCIEVNRNNAIERIWLSSSTGKQVENKVNLHGHSVPCQIGPPLISWQTSSLCMYSHRVSLFCMLWFSPSWHGRYEHARQDDNYRSHTKTTDLYTQKTCIWPSP